MNMAQHLLALPSLRTLHASTYLPHLPPAFKNTALTSLEVTASGWVTSMESWKLTELLNVSPHINNVVLTVPFDERLIGRGNYSRILKPISKALKTLVPDYDIKGQARHWEQREDKRPWPQLLSLANFPVLTRLDISWHFFFGKSVDRSRRQWADPDIILHLPKVLEKLTIHDIPIALSSVRHVANRVPGYHLPADDSQFLRHLQKLGIAHRTGVLGKMKEVKLEVLLTERMSPKVLLPFLILKRPTVPFVLKTLKMTSTSINFWQFPEFFCQKFIDIEVKLSIRFSKQRCSQGKRIN